MSVLGQSFTTNYDPDKKPEPPKGKQWIHPAGPKAPRIRKDKIWGDVVETGLAVHHNQFWHGEYFLQFSKPDVHPARARVIGVFDGIHPNLTVEFDGTGFKYNDKKHAQTMAYPQEVHRLAKAAYEGLQRGHGVATEIPAAEEKPATGKPAAVIAVSDPLPDDAWDEPTPPILKAFGVGERWNFSVQSTKAGIEPKRSRVEAHVQVRMDDLGSRHHPEYEDYYFTVEDNGVIIDVSDQDLAANMPKQDEVLKLASQINRTYAEPRRQQWAEGTEKETAAAPTGFADRVTQQRTNSAAAERGGK